MSTVTNPLPPFLAPFPRTRVTDEPGPSTTCVIFRWIGQSFQTCDECSAPVTQHLYHPTYGGGRPELYVKQWDRFLKRWEWQAVTVIKRKSPLP